MSTKGFPRPDGPPCTNLEFLLQLPVDVDDWLDGLLDGVDPAPVHADLGEDGREAEVSLVRGAQRDLKKKSHMYSLVHYHRDRNLATLYN